MYLTPLFQIVVLFPICYHLKIMNEFKKLRATIIIGPHGMGNLIAFSRASWPFGSIKISKERIIISPFFYSEEIEKEQIVSLKQRKGLFNSVEIIYKKNGNEWHAICSPLFLSEMIKIFNEFGYELGV